MRRRRGRRGSGGAAPDVGDGFVRGICVWVHGGRKCIERDAFTGHACTSNTITIQKLTCTSSTGPPARARRMAARICIVVCKILSTNDDCPHLYTADQPISQPHTHTHKSPAPLPPPPAAPPRTPSCRRLHHPRWVQGSAHPPPPAPAALGVHSHRCCCCCRPRLHVFMKVRQGTCMESTAHSKNYIHKHIPIPEVDFPSFDPCCCFCARHRRTCARRRPSVRSHPPADAFMPKLLHLEWCRHECLIDATRRVGPIPTKTSTHTWRRQVSRGSRGGARASVHEP